MKGYLSRIDRIYPSLLAAFLLFLEAVILSLWLPSDGNGLKPNKRSKPENSTQFSFTSVFKDLCTSIFHSLRRKEMRIALYIYFLTTLVPPVLVNVRAHFD